MTSRPAPACTRPRPRSRRLTGAVADDGRGIQAPGAQQLREGHLDAEVGGLGDLRLAHARAGLLRAQLATRDQPSTGGGWRRRAPSPHGRRARTPAAPGPWPTTAGPCRVDERHVHLWCASSPDPPPRPAARRCPRRRPATRPAPGRSGPPRQTVRVVAAPVRRRPRQLGERRRALGIALVPLRQLAVGHGQAPQRLTTARRQGHQRRARATFVGGRAATAGPPAAPRARCAAEAERVHRREGRALALRQRLQLPGHAQLQLVEVDIGVGLDEVQVRRTCLFFSTSAALMRPATPRGRSRWPMFVFTEPPGTSPPRAARAKHLAQRLGLDGITHRRAGAVRLDVAHLAGGDARQLQRLRASFFCASPLGTVMPGVRPSWLDAVARMTA